MIDLQKCFDTIDPRVVEVFMRSKGVNGTLLKNTMQKYCQKKVRAKAKGKQSVLRSEWYEERKVVGAPQGGVDSMEFLTVITDHLEEALIEGGVKGVSVAKVWDEHEGGWRDERVWMQLLADDLILFAEDVADLQKAVDVCMRVYGHVRMVPNPTKCEVMCWDDKGGAYHPKIEINGKVLARATKPVYLGLMLDRRSSWAAHRRMRRKKARGWRYKMRRVAKRRGAMPVGKAALIGRCGEGASSLYGVEMWLNGTEERMRSIEEVQMRQERVLLGLPERTPAIIVRDEMGTESWVGESMVRRMKLLAEMVRDDRQQGGRVMRARVNEIRHRDGWNGIGESQADWVGETRRMMGAVWGETDAFGMWVRIAEGREPWEELEREVQGAVMRLLDERDDRRRKVTARKINSVARGEWHVKWRDARDDLTTDEIRWVERARAGVLEVGEETGRWEEVAREDRVCSLCQREVETGAHALGVCPALVQARWETERELDRASRGVVTRVTQAMEEIEDDGKRRRRTGEELRAVEEWRRKHVIRVLNRGIGRIMHLRAHLMQEKDRVLEGKPSRAWQGGRDDTEVDAEEEDLTREEKAGLRSKKKGKRRRVRVRFREREEERGRSGREMADMQLTETKQKINTRRLEEWIEAGEAKTEHERDRAEAILAEAVKGGGWLTQKYRRRGKGGRWHATGRAQLQSVSKRVRKVALEGQGIEVDMENAHVVLMMAAAESIGGKRGVEWPHFRKYVGDKRRGRNMVAEGFGTSTEAAKNLFLTLIFGGTVQSWARRWGVHVEKARRSRNRSEGASLAYGFEMEVRRACSAIMADRRVQGERPATTLQRFLSSMEEEVMQVARTAVEVRGFSVGTLIHDALVLNRKDVEGDGEQERREAAEAVGYFVQDYVRMHGWREREDGGVNFATVLT